MSNDEAAAEAAAIKAAAEAELTFSLPGLFSKADPERMRTAIAAARVAGVDEAAVADVEGKMARVLEREEEERKRLVKVQETEAAEAAAKQVAEEEKAAVVARALAREMSPEATKLRRASTAAISEIDVDALQGAIAEARRAGVSTEAVNEGVTKVAQAKRWSAATDALDAAIAAPTAEVSPEVVMYRLRTSVVEARAVGLPDSKVEAAATQLSQMEEVVDVPEHAQSAGPPWHCPSSAPAPPQGAPGGPGQLGTPRKRPANWMPSHCLGCPSQPPPTSQTRLPLTM